MKKKIIKKVRVKKQPAIKTEIIMFDATLENARFIKKLARKCGTSTSEQINEAIKGFKIDIKKLGDII